MNTMKEAMLKAYIKSAMKAATDARVDCRVYSDPCVMDTDTASRWADLYVVIDGQSRTVVEGYTCYEAKPNKRRSGKKNAAERYFEKVLKMAQENPALVAGLARIGWTGSLRDLSAILQISGK